MFASLLIALTACLLAVHALDTVVETNCYQCHRLNTDVSEFGLGYGSTLQSSQGGYNYKNKFDCYFGVVQVDGFGSNYHYFYCQWDTLTGELVRK